MGPKPVEYADVGRSDRENDRRRFGNAAGGDSAVETSHMRGIVIGLMSFRLRPCFAHALVALAIASIAVGPSPAAAAAEMSARSKRDRESRPKEKSADKSPQNTTSKSGDHTSEAEDAAASFVAPTSAKPADMQGGSPIPGSLPAECNVLSPATNSLVVPSGVIISIWQPHRLPHQPNAPPRA